MKNWMRLELELVSAEDLKCSTDVYAVVSLCKGQYYVDGQKGKSEVVRNCGTRVDFNESPMSFTLDDDESSLDRFYIKLKLVSKRMFLFDKTIGKVFVSVKELYESAKPSTVKELLNSSGNPKGIKLTFSFKFVDDEEPPRLKVERRLKDQKKHDKNKNKSDDCCYHGSRGSNDSTCICIVDRREDKGGDSGKSDCCDCDFCDCDCCGDCCSDDCGKCIGDCCVEFVKCCGDSCSDCGD